MMKYSWKSRSYTFLTCIFFVILWEIIARIINNDIYIPRVNQIVEAVCNIYNDKNFFIIVFDSVYRTMISYFLALILSMILGVASILLPGVKYMMEPINSFLKTIPTMVLIVLLLVWFDKEITPFAVGFAIVFPILYEGIRNNIMQIDKKIIDMVKVYEISLIDKIRKIYFPTIKFYFMSIFVSTFSLTFKVVIAGEVYGQPKFGIGSQIQVEKINFNTPGIFAWIFIIIIISLSLEMINIRLKKKIYRWMK